MENKDLQLTLNDIAEMMSYLQLKCMKAKRLIEVDDSDMRKEALQTSLLIKLDRLESACDPVYIMSTGNELNQ